MTFTDGSGHKSLVLLPALFVAPPNARSNILSKARSRGICTGW